MNVANDAGGGTETMVSRLPKAEMHVHLEGAARPSLARELAARYGENIDDLLVGDGETYRWNGFDGFLDAYDRVAALFRTQEDFALLTRHYLDELHAACCLYAEIIVSPGHAERTGLSADAYLDGIAEGIRAHSAEHGDEEVETRLLVTGVRHEGADAVEEAAGIAARWFSDGPRAGAGDEPLVAGFGLAGDERVGRPEDFAGAFALAREAGLGTACHAGEVCGPESVRGALDELKVDRIDHGVRAAADEALVAQLADKKILLTVCPGSNLSLGVYPALGSHPLAQLAESGCLIALGADDPPHFGTSLTGEYALAAEAGLDETALQGITRNAIEHAFCGPATKRLLLGRLDATTG